jgi:hypothetical protein
MKTPVVILTAALGLTTLLPPIVSAEQEPTTGYAPVNGLKMYYEVHGNGDPVVLLHGAFGTITRNWSGWIDELSKTRKVIAVEMQGHGRTALWGRWPHYTHRIYGSSILHCSGTRD